MASGGSRFVVFGMLGLILAAFALTVWWGINRADSYAPQGRPQGAATATQADLSPHRALDNGGKAGDDETPPPLYHLRLVGDDGDLTPLASLNASPARVVLLVHGLDDPGWTFDHLIDALREASHEVVRFDYRNDQSIARSAADLTDAMNVLGNAGVERVDIIGHSMGGLVARSMLADRPASSAPAVDRFIMLGTPNHGSHLARLRGIAELGEQVSRLWSGERDLFRFLDDGAGEAGRDLLPGSTFLDALNARALPSGVAITIVAGEANPIDADLIASWVEVIRSRIPQDRLPQWAKDRLNQVSGDAVKTALGDLATAVGDGCVTVESARLEGVADFVVIQADHIGMIHDYLNSGLTPPAIPIVLERLHRDATP